MRICSNFFVTLRWYCSYLEDRKKKFHPRDGHGGPDTPMFKKKKKKSKEEKHYMSSRCSCGVIKVSTARCDIPLRLEAATLATRFLDHNAASAPPRRRKHSTFPPPFLARVWNRSPLKVRRHVVCFSWFFFGACATLFPSTKLKVRCRQICRHCFKTSIFFLFTPLSCSAKMTSRNGTGFHNDGRFILKSRACDPRVWISRVGSRTTCWVVLLC